MPSAAATMHSVMPQPQISAPQEVSPMAQLELRRRSSSGSIPIFSASSSSWHSVAKATCGLPKPRNAVPISLLV